MRWTALLVLCGAQTALAESPAELFWLAPAECASKAEVHAGIRQWLGPSYAEAKPVAVSVRAVIQADVRDGGERELVLDLTLMTPTGESRDRFRASACKTLVDLVALKTALLIDPVRVAQSANVESSPAPAPSPATPPEGRSVASEVGEVVPSEPAERVDQQAGDDVLRSLTLRLDAEVMVGLWPKVAFGTAAWLGWQGSLLRVEAGVRHLFERSIHYDAPSDVGARVALWAGAARVCVVPKLGQVELPICVGADAGRMRGTGFGLSDARTSRQPWLAAGVGPGIAVPLRHGFWLSAFVDGMAQLVRVSYHARNLPTLYTSDRTAMRAGIGVEWRIP